MNLRLLLLSFFFVLPAHGWEWAHEIYEDHCEDYIHLNYVDNNGKPKGFEGINFYLGEKAGIVVAEQFQDSMGMGMGVTMYLGGNGGEVIDPPGPGPDGDMHKPPNYPDEPEPVPLPPDPDPEPDPDPPGVWSYRIHNFANGGCTGCGTWSNDDKVRMNAGAWVAGKVMNDPAMQSKVIGNGCNYQVAGSSYSYGSVPCGSYIWNDIYEARERSWNNVVNYTGDVLYLRIQNSGCSFIGSAFVPGNTWKICKPVYDNNNYQPASVAGNMIHEWSHNMGYGHCGSCSTRSSTIPYRLGQYAREEGLKYQNEARSLFPRNW